MFSGMTITLLLQIASAAFAGFGWATMFVWSIWAANRLLRSGAKIWRLPLRIPFMFLFPIALTGWSFLFPWSDITGDSAVVLWTQASSAIAVGALCFAVFAYAGWKSVLIERSGRAKGDLPFWVYALLILPLAAMLAIHLTLMT